MLTRLMTAAAVIAVLAMLSIQTIEPAQADHHKKGEKAGAKEAPHNVAPDGFTALFNGKDIEGWEIKSGIATYVVEDGMITGTTVKGSPNSFLCTPKEYGDFELHFDVMLHDNQLNSGVQLRSKIVKDDKWGGRLGGPQCEIEKGPGQSGLIYGEASGGWQSAKEKTKKGHEQFKNGQWNHYRIICKGNNIKTYINGEQVEDLDLNAKYHERFTQGVLGLQVHSVGGDPKWRVSWRNIYIKELGK